MSFRSAQNEGIGKAAGSDRRLFCFLRRMAALKDARRSIYGLLARYIVAIPMVMEFTCTSEKPFFMMISRNTGGW